MQHFIKIERDKSAVRATGYGLDIRGSIRGRRNKIFSILQHPHRFAPTKPLILTGFWALYLREYRGRGVKLTTRLNLVLRSRMVELYLNFPYVFMELCLIN
jgi:hypothetical protein